MLKNILILVVIVAIGAGAYILYKKSISAGKPGDIPKATPGVPGLELGTTQAGYTGNAPAGSNLASVASKNSIQTVITTPATPSVSGSNIQEVPH